MGDTGNALLATIAILGALYHRERTGEGQAVSTSIVNAGLLHTSYAWIDADGTPADWGHVDADQYGLSPWYRLYRCADDGWLVVAALRTGDRHALLHGVLDDDEADIDLDDHDKVAALLEEGFLQRPAASWFEALDAVVPLEVVDEAFCRDLFDDDVARRTQLVVATQSTDVGRFEDPGLLVQLSATPGVVTRGPSACGEHTREILLELRRTDDQVDALVAEGVVLEASPVAP
jgi:crotonobetainyl-CoA:carnitine CoA-transferase CaiB-like acyl-CoA transferase